MNLKRLGFSVFIIIIIVTPMIFADIYFKPRDVNYEFVISKDGYGGVDNELYFVQRNNRSVDANVNIRFDSNKAIIYINVYNTRALWLNMEKALEIVTQEVLVGTLTTIEDLERLAYRFYNPLKIVYSTDSNITDVRLYNVIEPSKITIDAEDYNHWGYNATNRCIQADIPYGRHELNIYISDLNGQLTHLYEKTKSTLFMQKSGIFLTTSSEIIKSQVTFRGSIIREEIDGFILTAMCDEQCLDDSELSFKVSNGDKNLDFSPKLWKTQYFIFATTSDGKTYRIKDVGSSVDGVEFVVPIDVVAIKIYTNPRWWNRLNVGFDELIGRDNINPYD